MKCSILIFITLLLMGALIVREVPAKKFVVPAMKPNIIFFLSDDMGWGDSKVYNPDSKIPMPNLEKLAVEGMMFTDAHTPTPVCAPTRYSILTGNYPWRGRYPWGNWNYTRGSQILSDQWTVAKILQDNGYNTAFIGKLHLGGDFYKKNSDEFVRTWLNPEDQVDFARGFQNGPLRYGFNYSYALLRGHQNPPYAFFENDRLVGNPDKLILWKKGTYGNSIINFDGIGMPDWDSSKVGPILTQKAIEFIDRHHQKNLAEGTHTPFFLFYSSQAAHSPLTPPDLFHGEPVKGVTGMTPHTDMIYEIDVALGKLIYSIEQRGLTNNTLIIFTSDNGGIPAEISFGHNATSGLRGQKVDIWEGGHRVPFIAKWGDGTLEGSVIPPGATSNQLIGVQDLTVTLAALVGQTLPANQAQDSFNFLPVLLGEQSDTEPVRDHLIIEAGFYWTPWFSIRVGKWKLILDKNYDLAGLYNLTDDLAETHNLMDDPGQGERIELMRKRFIEIKGTSGADFIRGLGGHNDVMELIMRKGFYPLVQVVIFIIGSVVITMLSWRSLQNPKSHRFYLFFAFEAILIVILLNMQFWLKTPLSPLQMISWFFLLLSLIFFFQRFYILRKMGCFESEEESQEPYAFEKTLNLITAGIYKYIRHPLYSSLLLLAWSFYLKHISIVSTILILFVTASLIVTAKMEERSNLLSFGSAYLKYVKNTKMFIPFVF